jgi:hypothetical protein
MIGARVLCCSQEVITIDLICEVCGTSNPPGTEFCTNCNSYLAWDRSVGTKPAGKPAQPTSPAPTPPPQPQAEQTRHAGTAAAGYPNTGPSDQGYVDPGYAAQGYYDAGYNEGAYYQGPYDMSCPNCGTINPGTRRFCSRCGYGFVSGEDPYAGYAYWSPASQAAQDKAARKAYRRSLPPLYRWRRVIIGVLVVALVAVAAIVLGSNPGEMVKSGWYSLTRDYVWVKPVTATVVPPEANAPNSKPAALVDEAENEWTMNWAPSQETQCGPAPGTGVIVLTFAPTRIRMLQIAPGLAESNPQRKLQPLPKVLGVAFDNGPCQTVNLTATPGQQEIKIDSGKPVSQMLIGINSAYPAPNAQPMISLTEVILKAYPS